MAHLKQGGQLSTDPVHKPSISLVIPCYSTDRIPDLSRLFGSVTRQSTTLDELILVVQQSQGLKTWVESNMPRTAIGAAHVVYLDTTPQVSRARNAGADASQGDIIAFVDDDAVLADDWAAMTRQFYNSDSEAIGVAGAIMPLWDSPAMEWFPRELYWVVSCTYWTSARPTVVRNGYGANMSFRREAFEAGRRFNEATGICGWGQAGWHGMGGEEPEFSHRVTDETARPILYVPDIRVWHRVKPYRLRNRALVRRAYWEGRFKAWFDRRHGRKALDTERSLLDAIGQAAIQRLRLGLRHPVLATRQQCAVKLVILCVAFGYIDGKLRMIGKPRPSGHRRDRQ